MSRKIRDRGLIWSEMHYQCTSITSVVEKYDTKAKRFSGLPEKGSAISHSKLNLLGGVSLFVRL